jgi:hypothetical protein
MNYHLEGDFHNYIGLFYRVLGFGDGNDEEEVLGFDRACRIFPWTSLTSHHKKINM